MANYLSPIGNGQQFNDSNGSPLSGALLFTYTAGSSTKRTTYTDINAGGSNTNPIVLDSSGRPPSPIWLIGSETYKFVLAPANDTDPPTSAIETWDNLSGINDTSVSVDQWVSGPTPTYVSGTEFTLVGDQTTTFHVGRRIKATVGAGTVYGRISVTAFTVLTTVTVVLDSGALDAGLSAVSYGLLTATNQSLDVLGVKRAISETGGTMTGGLTMSSASITMTAGSINFAEGSAVTSAATANIWATDGNTVHITGSTGPITSLGTAPQAGASRWVIFDSTPTLTHSTNLNLPGSVDYTAEAGDFAYVYADTTTQFDVQIFKKSGLPAIAGQPRRIGTFSSSNAANCAIVFPAEAVNYPRIALRGTVHAHTDDTTLYLRTSTNGGSSYDSSAGNYTWAQHGRSDSGAEGNDIGSDSAIQISNITVGRNFGNAADESGFIEIIFDNPYGTTYKKNIRWLLANSDPSAGVTVSLCGSGNRQSTSDIDAARLEMSSGNITVENGSIIGMY